MAGVPYTRLPQRFFFAGISLLPPDSLPAGKYPYAQNVRSYQEGVLQPRDALSRVSNPATGGIVHSLARLNDPTPYATLPAIRLIGAGVDLYTGTPAGPVYTNIDTGYSGDPLSIVVTSPVRSPQPWAYIGDRSRQRKVNNNSVDVPIGIAQPNTPPTLTLGAPGVTVINDLDASADWTAVGSAAAAPSDITPVSTTIGTIVYDSGNTGYASISPAAFTNIHVGQRLSIASAESVLVTDVLPAIATTTIAQIIYDAGNTGLCTIQPTASLGTGQLDGPQFDEYRRRFFPALEPGVDIASEAATTQGPSRVRTIDFPVNCLVTIGGATETVRILSVAVGKDGIQSFRCSTGNTHAAADSLTGVACFRAFTTATRAAGNTVVGLAIQQVITPTTVEPVVGGMQESTLAVDLSLVGGRATQPEDELLLSVKVDLMSFVTSVRIYLDVDAATNDFLQNYFFHEWRANDIIAAIHATNTSTPVGVQDARLNAVLQNQVDQPVTPPWDWQQGVQDYSGAIGTGVPGTEVALGGYVAPPPQPATGAPTALTATSSQLALGNSQWITLKVKIADLVHVGTDLTRTLRNVAAAEILLTIAGTTSAVTVQYDSALIQGGYGPDVGDTGMPYTYGYRYRSSTTGAYSNMSPPSRNSVVPRRQRITGTATASGDAQADLIDWFRFGGQLTRWTYVMTASALTDDVLDGAIEGGEAPNECFQPWPTSDLPRSGTCTVAGTAVTRTGGDTFNTSWAPGTTITINGVTTALYAAPTSTTLLHVVANCGSGTGLAWSIREPLLLSQNLPALWGGVVSQVVFLFACGDSTDPGALHWSIGNNPDGTKDAHWLAVTDASEPLQNGFIYDGVSYVFSTENLYRLPPSFGQLNMFRADKTPCGRGLWSRWAFAVAPEGVYFLAKDGIYLSQGGSVAQSITDPDLKPIFPHDGVAGVTTNGIVPPDMTLTSPVGRMKLTVVGDYLYFDHSTTANDRRTWVYNRIYKRWESYDIYAVSGVTARLSEPGPQVVNNIVGCANGNIYSMLQTAFSDDGTAIAWQVATPYPDAGDPRREKQWGDAMLDYNMQGATQNLSVVATYNNGGTSLPALTFGAATTGRREEVLDLASGDGILARNFGLVISGSSVAGDANRPFLYVWEPAFIPKVEESDARATDWDLAGYPGSKQVRGVIMRVNTFGQNKVVEIQYDGGTVGATITVNTTSEQKVAFAFPPFYAKLLRLAPTTNTPWMIFDQDIEWTADAKPELTALYTDWSDAGYPGAKFMQGIVVWTDNAGVAQDCVIQYDNSTVGDTFTIPATTAEDGFARSFPVPFTAHTLRIVPQGPFRLIRVEWKFEPAPEFAKEWITQPTTHDLPGYLSVTDAVLAYNAPADIIFSVTYDDGSAVAYLLPAGSAYQRVYTRIAPRKGRSVVYRVTSSAAFQLFVRDCSVRVQGWGLPGGYMQTMPFGGPSRAVGATI